MEYCLSKRQVKELANGKLLRIALPAPQTTPQSWRRWATEQLPEVADAICEARLSTVWVYRPGRSDNPIETQIGVILRDDQTAPYGAVPIEVSVVIVELLTRREPRGVYPVQWPQAVDGG